MREIGSVRQDSARGYRRWFQDEYFDVFVWQDAGGRPIALQLCYDRDTAEGVISWSETDGFAHARVDGGAKQAKYGMTPILRPDGMAPYFRIYNRFLAATPDWDPALRSFVLERLRDYRRLLFGTRRTPRRRPKQEADASPGEGVLTLRKAGSTFRTQHHGADLNLSLRAPNKTG